MIKLHNQAIDEIVYILNEVKSIKKLVEEMGITLQSDSWSATFPIDHDYENILEWNRKDFEELDVSDIKGFSVGGCVTTYEHKYKDKYVTEPKELAEAKSDTVKQYFISLIKSLNPKFFELQFNIPYGICNNCGWEHFMSIEATIEKNALQDNGATKKLIKQITNEQDMIIELSGCPIYENPKYEFEEDSKLVPKGDFAYMIEFFSSSLVDPSDDDYIGCFSEHDYNGKYIRDCMKLINNIEKKAQELRNKYANKGVKVTIGDFNEGCQYGMAIYVWIPHQ